jgi:GDPmannose 4,6-dehydratase
MKRAIVTGITGQDGAYLAELLLAKGYEVYGARRHVSTPNFWRIEELGVNNHPNFKVIEYDITDFSSIARIINQVEPDEIYNLAAQSFVAASFHQPVLTSQINAIGPLNILEAIRIINPKIKYYQASTSELFGKVQETPQRESTPFYPRSPYGVAKLYAHWLTVNYRESYGIFAASGILFNHESPLRGIEFVTRKITDTVAQIKLGKKEHVELGNIDAQRDWGHARDYVDGMYRMLQVDTPDSFVLSTGRTVAVREFVRMSFEAADIHIEFSGSGIDEVARNTATGKVVMKINPEFYRPAEVDMLVGDPSKAYDILGWKPETPLKTLCQDMVLADIRRQSIKGA